MNNKFIIEEIMNIKKGLILAIMLICIILCTVSIASAGTFEDVQNAVDNPDGEGNVFLNGSNYTGNGSEITINTSNLKIYGGSGVGDVRIATLDGCEKSRIMNITGSNITFIGIKFINGISDNGGAIYIKGSNTTWIDCAFLNNTRTSRTYGGGAIYINGSKNSLFNCTFENNEAGGNGGAIYINGSKNSLFNCTFLNNHANSGGAIFYYLISNNNTWTDCTFINNTAKYGGAIQLSTSYYSTWTNCTFINNTAENNNNNGGGAIYLDKGSNNTWTDCNFINNKATAGRGGAISFHNASDNHWKNCIFTNNTANTDGGAIYFFIKSNNNTWFNCTFTNNTASDKGGAIYINGSDNSITYCIFDNNNAPVAKALYVNDTVNCDYNFWGSENGINPTQFKELNLTNTNPNVIVILKIIKTDTGYKFNFIDNKTLNTVNMPTYTANVTINNTSQNIVIGTSISTNEPHIKVTSLNSGKLLSEYIDDSFTALNEYINTHINDSTIILPHDYHYYNEIFEQAFKEGIKITKDNLVIDGKGSTISGSALALIFHITANNITFKNINFINGNSSSGGAIYITGSNTSWINCSFLNNTRTSTTYGGGAIYIEGSENKLFNCTFENNEAGGNGGAIYINGIKNSLFNCTFLNNHANSGGAIFYYLISNNNTWTECTFINNTAKYGGAIQLSTSYYTTWTNCTFINNTAENNNGGGAIYLDKGSNNTWTECNFINNKATAGRGGAISFHNASDNHWKNCIFTKNTANTDGGAIYFFINSNNNTWFNCTFTNNTASNTTGGAIYINGSDNSITYCIFDNNNAPVAKALYVNDTVNCDYNFWGTNNTITTEEFKELNLTNANPNVIVILKIIETSTGYKFNFADNKTHNTVNMPTYTANVTINNTSQNIVIGESITTKEHFVKVTSLNSGQLLAEYTAEDSFTALNDYINTHITDSAIILPHDYQFYNEDFDKPYKNGINITQDNLIIDGNGSAISGSSSARIFYVTANNITFKNINFINGSTDSSGGAIFVNSSSNSFINCNFVSNTASNGAGASIYFNSGFNNSSRNTLDYCNFTGNKAFKGSAIYTSSNLNIENCIFTDNQANATDIAFNRTGYLLNITLRGNDNILDAIFADNCNVTVNGTDITPTSFVSGKINLTGLFGLITVDSGDIIDLNTYNYPTKINATHCEDSLYTYITKDYSLSYNVTVYFDVDDFNGANGTDVSGLVNVTIRDNSSAKINITSFNATISQNGTVILSFNSASLDKDGKLTITLPSNAGKYNLTIIPADSHYNSTLTTKEITVKTAAIPVISPSSVIEKENFTITVKFPTDATGNVTVTIANQTVNGTLVNGTILLNFTGLKAGTYNVVVTYSGDENYGRFENLKVNVLTVKSRYVPPTHKYELKADNVTKFVNGTEFYAVRLTDYGKPLANQEILITLNEAEYTCVTDKNGTATLDLDLEVGKYTVTAKWNRYKVENTITVKPIPHSYELKGDNVIKYFKGSEIYTVTLTDNGKPLAGETITITINGKEYTRVTDEKGTASMAINLNAGTYAVTASWNDLTVKNTITVKTTIHCDDFTKYYLNGTQYEAYVLDSVGNPLDNVNVTFNIHGVFCTRTAHNGTVKLNINLLPGGYIITAYNDVTGEASSATVTVLPTLIGSDLNMTFQDGSKYECKLVDGQGNPVKGAEVTFNIHGVFYHKITDEKGIARLNINLLSGEYLITGIYDELTMTSNTITVRDL